MRTKALTASLVVLAIGLLAAGCTGSGPSTVDADTSGDMVWVANEGEDSLTVLDAETGQAVSTLTGVDAPHNVQAASDGDQVWVTGTGGVIAIDTESLAVRHVAPAGNHPAHVVGGPDGVLVTAYGDGALHHLSDDLVPHGVRRIGGGPHGLRVAPDGSFVAVANHGAGTVDLITLPLPADHDGAAAATRSVPVGPRPVQVAVSADSSTLYVSVSGRQQVVRVDVATGKVTGRVRVAAAPAQVWVTSDGLLLSADQGTEDKPGTTLSLIDADTMRVVDEVTTGAGPHGIVVTEDETSAWVTNTFEGTVTLVDLAEGEPVGTYPVGDHPNGITITSTAVASGTRLVTELLMPVPYAPAEGAGTDGHGHGGDDGDDGHAH